MELPTIGVPSKVLPSTTMILLPGLTMPATAALLNLTVALSTVEEPLTGYKVPCSLIVEVSIIVLS